MRVPGRFWGEAVKAAVYLLNRAPTKSLNKKTPFEAWFRRKPNVRHLRTFGCMAYAKRTGPGINKLADRSTPGVFLGYEPGTKGYRVYDLVNNKLIVTRDVIFDEKRGWNWVEKDGRESNDAAAEAAPYFSVEYAANGPDGTVHGPAIELIPSAGLAPGAAEPPSPAMSIPSVGGTPSTPPHTPLGSVVGSASHIQWATPPTDASEDFDGEPRRYRTIPNLFDTTDEVQGLEYSGLCLAASGEPITVEEAMSKKCWRQAMESEMKAIEDNKT
jgi:hypothetical protein